MSGKTLWSVIFGLVILNCLTVAYFINPYGVLPVNGDEQEDEVIATIGETTITREQWMAELETRYGKDTLRELVNVKVVEELAEKYDLSVSDEVIERELTFYKSMYTSLDEEQFSEEQNWEQQIRYSILLEELLTKDVEVPEEDLRSFYENNKELYDIKDIYHLSHIVVKTEEEAKAIIKELAGGSSFEALALEASIDEFTANQGGDIGFISTDNDYVSKEYLEIAPELSAGDWSHPIKVNVGYAVLLLKEKLVGKTYSYDEVKDQIRRQIALEKMEGAVTADPLWQEIGVSWFYEDETGKN